MKIIRPKTDSIYSIAMMQVQDEQKGTIQYIFQGDLGVSALQEIYSQLSEHKIQKGIHYFQVSEVEHLDMSFFQVLYAYIQKLRKGGKEVKVNFQLDEEYSRVFDRSGLRKAFDQLING